MAFLLQGYPSLHCWTIHHHPLRFLAVCSEELSLSCPYSGEMRDCTWEIYVKSVCLASEQQSKTIFNAVHHPESLWNWAALEI